MASIFRCIYNFSENWDDVIKAEKIDDAIAGTAYLRFFKAVCAYPMGWTPPGGIKCAKVAGVETPL